MIYRQDKKCFGLRDYAIMQKKIKNNIRSTLLKILIIIASISTIIFIRDVLVKRGVSITMLTELDYINEMGRR